MPGGHHPRRTIEHRTEVIALAQLGFAGRQTHPHRQLHARCAATAASTADLGDANAAHTPSPVCLNNQPPCASIAERNTSSRAASAVRIASASASHRRVEPSTSVNRNVTTPEGAAPVMASPRPTSYVPRSQAFSPCRGSDPGIRDKGRRHREPAPAEPAAAAARCLVSPTSSARAAANRSIAASASATSSGPAIKQCLHQNTRRRNAPSSSCPSRRRSSTAVRMSGMASSRSPRLALSRAKYTLTIGKSPRLCPPCWNTSLTSASSSCPRSRSASVWRCTSAKPSVTGRGPPRRHRWIVRPSAAHPRSRAPHESSGLSTPTVSRTSKRSRRPWRRTWGRRCEPWPGRAAGHLPSGTTRQ